MRYDYRGSRAVRWLLFFVIKGEVIFILYNVARWYGVALPSLP